MLTIALVLCVGIFVALLFIAYRMAHSSGIEAKKFAKNPNNIHEKILEIDVSGFISLKRFEFPLFRKFKSCGYGVSKLDVNPWINPTYSLFYFNKKIRINKNILISNYDSRDVFYIKNYDESSDLGVLCNESGCDSAVCNFQEKFSGISAFMEISPSGLLFGFRVPAKNDKDMDFMFSMCESFLNDLNSGELSLA